MLSKQLEISQGSYHTILHKDFDKIKVCAKFVPYWVTTAQKEFQI